MISDYYNPCSILEPIVELFPCGPFSEQLFSTQEDDGGTPKHSNRSPRNEAYIESVPSAMSTSTDTRSYHDEHISSLQKISHQNSNHYNAGYDQHPYCHYEQREEAYDAPIPYSYADQSPWHPPLSTPAPWQDSRQECYESNNYWQPSYQQQQQQMPMPPQAPQQHWEQEALSYPSRTNAELSTVPSREEQCSTPCSVATEMTSSIESKRDLRTLDIVCGRGAPTNYHYGNQVFRELVEDHQTSYLCAKRSDKPHIAMKLMDLVKENGGRFVRRQRTAEGLIWQEINDKGAYEKVCQALRDGAPDLRRQVMSKLSKSTEVRGELSAQCFNETKEINDDPDFAAARTQLASAIQGIDQTAFCQVDSTNERQTYICNIYYNSDIPNDIEEKCAALNGDYEEVGIFYNCSLPAGDGASETFLYSTHHEVPTCTGRSCSASELAEYSEGDALDGSSAPTFAPQVGGVGCSLLLVLTASLLFLTSVV
eukprot:scaffold1697_cov120-Cylindrotheca_fusiformis.AAC.42